MLRAATAVAHLLPAQVLRLPDHARSATRCASSACCGLVRIGVSYIAARAASRSSRRDRWKTFHQPLRPRALPHLLQGLHREGLGRALRRRSSAEWGAQRIKGLSITQGARRTRSRARSRATRRDRPEGRRDVSLIERFLYPKFGPGQMWEQVAEQVERAGRRDPAPSMARRGHRRTNGERVTGVRASTTRPASSDAVAGDYFFSTMPVKELVAALERDVAGRVREVADGLALPRLHHGRPAARQAQARTSTATHGATAWSPTTGSTSRSPT